MRVARPKDNRIEWQHAHQSPSGPSRACHERLADLDNPKILLCGESWLIGDKVIGDDIAVAPDSIPYHNGHFLAVAIEMQEEIFFGALLLCLRK
jgi:hypothetical protein